MKRCPLLPMRHTHSFLERLLFSMPPIEIGIAASDLEKRGYVLHTTKPGDGKTFPRAGQRITMAYKGMLVDGTVFDEAPAFETCVCPW